MIEAQRGRAAEARARHAERLQQDLAIAGVRLPDWSQMPKGEGYCTVQGPRCADARVYTLERRPCCTYLVHEVARYTTEVLTALGIPWFADYGMLLGAVTRGGMFPWDKDTDLGVLQEHKRQILDLNVKLRRIGLGFWGTLSGTIKVYASNRNHTNCDLFAWHLNAGNWKRRTYAGVDQFKGREFPESWLFPLTTLEYDGITINAPAAVRWPGETPASHIPGFEQGSLFLEFRYGPGWMHPLRANNDVQWSHEKAVEMLRRMAAT